MTPRETLSYCLQCALAAVDGRRVVAGALPGLDLPDNCPVLALGKAAAAMLAGAADALGGRIGPALCISAEGAARPGEAGLHGVRQVHGDHPVPGAHSLAAGCELLAFLDGLPQGSPLLCLLSGGGSALAEALPEGVDPDELARANRWLLGSGLPIGAVNRVRARLSCLKAGRLAQRLDGHRVSVLAISDVPGDDPAVIASGPWTPSAVGALPELPVWLGSLLERAPPPPEPGACGLAEVDYRVIGRGAMAAEAACAAARELGLQAEFHPAPLQGTTAEAAEAILTALQCVQAKLHAWSGETTVTLPASPGAGGRNSHLALTLALALSGSEDRVALCAATDGHDGSHAAAGGWADGGVVARGAALGLDAVAALARADSGGYLAATGDALITGPTGTNVMDLVLTLRR